MNIINYINGSKEIFLKHIITLRVAKKIFEIIGTYIGTGLSSVVNLLNPEKVVIGGGVADAGDLLFVPIKEALKKRTMPIQYSAVEVVHAELGNTAGVIGASLLLDN